MAQFDFKKEMLVLHTKIDTNNAFSEADEFVFPREFSVNTKNLGKVGMTAALDFVDFMRTAFGAEVKLEDKGVVEFVFDKRFAQDKINYEILIGDEVQIKSADDKSFAQALYYIEFCLKERRYYALKKGQNENLMPYSPRMIHSGMALEEYPDEYLSVVAHYGYDAIIVFTKGVNQTSVGFLDFNDLCERAEKYGIGVYAYCYISNFTSPAAEGSAELYEKLYGSVFQSCPALKGMIFVGESVEFLSKDENVVKHKYNQYPKTGEIENKPSPGWWPCRDYSEWISLVRDSIRKYKKDADIVFWTYNWGWAPEEKRIELINALPTDITLLVTFEMFKKYKVMSVNEKVSDYSLTYPYCGDYFLSEAKAAKKRGIKLYTMCNTAGRTWDFGGLPFLPACYKWIERFKSINESHEKFGLVGLMEGHHYGFYPNFVSRLAYLSFMSEDYELNLDRALTAEYGTACAALKEGLKLVSESMQYLPPTIEAQYGPLRAGTTYPLCLIKPIQPVDYEGVVMGNSIWSPVYGQFESGLTLGFGDNGTPYAVREKAEMKMVEKMIGLLDKSLKKLAEVNEGNIEKLVNLLKYMRCCVVTLHNVMKFYHMKIALKTSGGISLKKAVAKIKIIARDEIRNAEESKEYLLKDSVLGHEPCMLYVTSPERIDWKIYQVNYMLKNELPFYETK